MAEPPPVALFVFARPETTARVWAAVRRARPRRLLLVADAARPGRPGEDRRCAETRALLKPDWPCRVARLYARDNLGCGRRLSSGLDWVFGRVPEAVILEDDCLPHPHFFKWCAALLARHRDDERVMHISGHVAPGMEAPAPHFSRYAFVWGWAGWRRAWRHYDFAMRDWPAHARGPWLRERLPGPAAVRLWRRNFRDAASGRVDTWDHQWTFALWRRGGLSVVPPRNLVSNIGLRDSTHPMDPTAMDTPTLPLSAQDLRPAAVAQDRAWDDAFERLHYSGPDLALWRRALRKLGRLARRAPGPPEAPQQR